MVKRATDGLIVSRAMSEPSKFLGRADEGIGEGLYDSVTWAFEVHVKIPDDKRMVCALLYGRNEDAPECIDFYAENNINALVQLRWTPDEVE